MKRVLMVGAGGWARQCWIEEVLQAFKEQVSVVGLTDVDESVLHESGELLNLPRDARFPSMEEAFEKARADFCVISIPPAHHRQAALLAVEKGMDILSEKPIADSHGDALDIYRAVTGGNTKMAITQNYRFEVPILTLKEVLGSGELGRMDYIVARYSSDYRRAGSWGVDNVYERDNPLLIEGAVHHFDMLRKLSGSNCETIAGFGWNPEWSSFKSNPSCLYLMQMENGVKASYEGNSLEAGQTNSWFHEHYRVQCEKGSVTVGRDQAVRIFRRGSRGQQVSEEVPPVRVTLTGHHAIMAGYLDWLDGGEPVETQVTDNIHSAAMVFAALDSGPRGEVKEVSHYLP